MAYKNIEVEEFINKTYSKDPAPGGGGVSSLCGSLGTALAGMVSNFTTGKKKYAEFEEEDVYKRQGRYLCRKTYPILCSDPYIGFKSLVFV